MDLKLSEFKHAIFQIYHIIISTWAGNSEFVLKRCTIPMKMHRKPNYALIIFILTTSTKKSAIKKLLSVFTKDLMSSHDMINPGIFILFFIMTFFFFRASKRLQIKLQHPVWTVQFPQIANKKKDFNLRPTVFSGPVINLSVLYDRFSSALNCFRVNLCVREGQRFSVSSRLFRLFRFCVENYYRFNNSQIESKSPSDLLDGAERPSRLMSW